MIALSMWLSAAMASLQQTDLLYPAHVLVCVRRAANRLSQLCILRYLSAPPNVGDGRVQRNL
jgi:hypothetical protein